MEKIFLDVCVDAWMLKKSRIHFVMEQGSLLYFLEVSFILAMLIVKDKIIVIRTERVVRNIVYLYMLGSSLQNYSTWRCSI